MRSPVTPLPDTARQLPEFAKPPVVEVACSIQFDPIDGLHAGLLGLLWEEYRSRYPRVEEQAPLHPTREEFTVAPPRMGIRMAGTFPMPRLWFLTEDGQRLVQVQRDHFIVNWRKLDTGAAYPHYPFLRAMLIEEIDVFQQFLADEKLAPIRAVQTELTYVNHIEARESDGSRKSLSRIVRIWADNAVGKLPDFEEAAVQAHYIMRDGEKPVGRLHVTIEPQRYVKDNAPLYALTLVARGAPSTSDVDGAIAFLDRGHETIVEGFTAITTDEMHKTWERQR